MISRRAFVGMPSGKSKVESRMPQEADVYWGYDTGTGKMAKPCVSGLANCASLCRSVHDFGLCWLPLVDLADRG